MRLYSDMPYLKGKLQGAFIKLWVWADGSDLHLGTQNKKSLRGLGDVFTKHQIQSVQ